MSINTVGVYWGDRRETTEACAERMLKFITVSSSCFPFLSNWRSKASSSEKCDLLDVGNVSGVIQLFRDGVQCKDIGGGSIPELGCSVGVVADSTFMPSVSVGVRCGVHSSNKNIGNCVVVKFPTNLGIENLEYFESLLSLMVELWEPDWGAIFSTKNKAFKMRTHGGPFLDLATWVSSDFKFETVLGGGEEHQGWCMGTLYIAACARRH
ncbi:Imm52 family immunity protein [Teredinibacter franksiae]|uniref:Imm52 family immunity protein n=1 Tax=Teredinibacter franksiae TaxID=2761453 RepID=UPI001627F0E7|nr:Imm52 family immunity protein [Teredinibacter franksiae]